jgi:hypothetical protein
VPGGSPALPGDRQPGLSRPGQHRVPQSRPQGEHVSYPNGDASLILYEDPPGISGENYPTNGALLYASPQAGNDGAVSGETCTLPDSEQALCTVILNDFAR